jgi:hypothetical protein
MTAPVDATVGTLRGILRAQLANADTYRDEPLIVACASAHGVDVTR